MRFIVIVPRSKLTESCYGVYRSFKRALGDAQAWNGYVLPIEKPEKHTFDSNGQSINQRREP